MTITQGVVTVTAPTESFVYGATVPASFTPGYAGFAPGESASSLDSRATCAPTTAVEGVGSYTIACSGAASGNYTFDYATGTLAITPAPLTVTGPAERFVYGEPVPASFPPAGYAGLAVIGTGRRVQPTGSAGFADEASAGGGRYRPGRRATSHWGQPPGQQGPACGAGRIAELPPPFRPLAPRGVVKHEPERHSTESCYQDIGNDH